MLFEITQICFNESDYATALSLSHEDNDTKRRQNDAETAAIMVLSYYYLAPVRNVLLRAHRDRCCSLVKLLYIYIYFCYFDLLNQG